MEDDQRQVDVAEDVVSLVVEWGWLITKPAITLLRDETLDLFDKAVNKDSLRRLGTRGDCLSARKHNNQNSSSYVERFVRGICTKKIHELTALRDVVNFYCKLYNCCYVADIGCGLGHLARFLVKEFGHSVLGIDCSADLCCRAGEQFSMENSGNECQKIEFASLHVDQSEECVKRLQEYLLHFVENQKQFHAGKPENVMLLSLHCCGDLRTSLLKLFRSTNLFACCIIVGCCYHKLTLNPDGFAVNFPLSSAVQRVLAGKDLFSVQHGQRLLNACALRLAAEQTKEMWEQRSPQSKQLHRNSLFFRAVVERLLEARGWKLIKTRRKPTKPGDAVDFETYLSSLLSRNVIDGCTDAVNLRTILNELYQKYLPYRDRFEQLIEVHMVLQAVIETLILQDGLHYFAEDDTINAEIRQLFDPAISPRNLAIVGARNFSASSNSNAELLAASHSVEAMSL